MININTDTYLIELTRGDNAVIEFTAEDDDGNTYLPETGDVLVFAVAKMRNKDPLFQIENEFGEFAEASPTQTEFEADPTMYFTHSSGTYTRCSESSTYSSSTQYYTSKFWDIEIVPENTKEMKSNTYVWDLQIEINGEIHTIIGETDTLDPRFKIWGEVAQ